MKLVKHRIMGEQLLLGGKPDVRVPQYPARITHSDEEMALLRKQQAEYTELGALSSAGSSIEELAVSRLMFLVGQLARGDGRRMSKKEIRIEANRLVRHTRNQINDTKLKTENHDN